MFPQDEEQVASLLDIVMNDIMGGKFSPLCTVMFGAEKFYCYPTLEYAVVFSSDGLDKRDNSIQINIAGVMPGRPDKDQVMDFLRRAFPERLN